MKRHNNLFDKIFTVEALYAAYVDAAKGKKSKRAVFEFERCLSSNLAALKSEIDSGSYAPQPYYRFQIYEPKPRIIYAPAFRDCVVQHAIYRVILPIFNRSFIDQSYACRPSYGTHRAADYAQSALRHSSPNSYTLKLDIKKYFYSIDRDILNRLFSKKLKDKRLLNAMAQFADYGEPKGIPIGNLLSQLYALIYLNPLDHYVKRELKTKYYCRYVDDFILFDLSKSQAVMLKYQIEQWLKDNLGLELSKYTIAPTSKGVNFVGYRTWRKFRFIRKHSLYKYRKSVRNNRLISVVSLLGHAKNTASLKHMTNLIEETNYVLYRSLPKIYRPQNHNAATTPASIAA